MTLNLSGERADEGQIRFFVAARRERSTNAHLVGKKTLEVVTRYVPGITPLTEYEPSAAVWVESGGSEEIVPQPDPGNSSGCARRC